jgi:putative LysE/RhtB family amino acid efflux pump
MVSLGFFIQQIAVGLAVSAIDAPAAILCMKKTLKQGFAPGLLVGLGSSVAYVVYSILGSLGIINLVIFYNGQTYAGAMGGVFLFWLGLMTFQTLPLTLTKKNRSTETHFYSFISAFFFTIANPVSILLFTIFYSTLGNGLDVQSSMPTSTLLGVFLGSSAWWLVLSGLIEKIRVHLSGKALIYINRMVGTVLMLWGCCALLKVWQHIFFYT